MAANFQASDGIRLAWHVDDYTAPWKPTVPLVRPIGSPKYAVRSVDGTP